jgi:hypothetical protein
MCGAGEIPASIGNLTSLTSLGLEENQLTGALGCRSSSTPYSIKKENILDVRRNSCLNRKLDESDAPLAE